MTRNMRNDIAEIIRQSTVKLREARLPGDLADQMEQLGTQLADPCVLAVVGRTKAGKSTFINALLKDDLAKVGITETTATINFFRYGEPADPSRPICCHWRGGTAENVTRAFLDSLQGNDLATLRRAAGIEYLEYPLSNPALREVTLVDTPGTEAAVDAHQNCTAEFLNLQRQLRDQHNRQTEHWASKAHAIIYLIGQVPRATDQAFLNEFAQATGGRSRALNAIGVMAKIDLQPEILDCRKTLAGKIAVQLKDGLNTVVPVSAGIRRALDNLQKDGNKGLIRLMTMLRKIPPHRLAKLLDSDELYEIAFDDCPVTVDERRQIRGDMPWGVFTTIARLAANSELSGQAIMQQLDELAGFGPLQEVLERHFFKRAHFLRYHSVLNDARRILKDIRFKHLPDRQKRDREEKAQQERFLAFIRSAASANPAVAGELERLVTTVLGASARADKLEMLLKELDRGLSQMFHDMDEYNADFEALQELEQHPRLFNQGEFDELRPLLGLYGVETQKRLPPGKPTVDYASGRQQYWMDIRARARDEIRRRIAERAEARYGLILHGLMTTKPVA